MKPAIFLDRDGTIIDDVGYPHRLDDLRLLPGAAAALRQLQELGFALVIVTNQSGIARGLFSEPQMHAFHDELRRQLRAAGVELAGIYYCPFHPTAGRGRYRRDSPLRKPAPGMLLLAASDLELDCSASYAIGDRPTDVAAGLAAGCRTILIDSTTRATDPAPHLRAANLLAAAQLIARERAARNAISTTRSTAYPACQTLSPPPQRPGDAA